MSTSTNNFISDSSELEKRQQIVSLSCDIKKCRKNEHWSSGVFTKVNGPEWGSWERTGEWADDARILEVPHTRSIRVNSYASHLRIDYRRVIVFGCEWAVLWGPSVVDRLQSYWVVCTNLKQCLGILKHLRPSDSRPPDHGNFDNNMVNNKTFITIEIHLKS